MKLRHVHHLDEVLVLVLVLKDSIRTYGLHKDIRTYFKFLSFSWSLGVRSLSLSLGGQVQEVLALVLGGQVLVLVLVLGGQVLVLVLGGQILVLILGGQVLVLVLVLWGSGPC